jgi:hypothetical protein
MCNMPQSQSSAPRHLWHGWDRTAGGGAQSILPGYHAMVEPPASRLFFICLPVAVRPGFNPQAAYLKNFHPSCNLGLNKHNNDISPIGDGGLVDTGFWHVPGMQPQNWNEGVRFHTLYGATEWTALYYNDNSSGGGPWSLKRTPYTNLWNYSSYDIQEAGITVDRPVPMPSSLAEFLPAVFRGEALYTNHQSFESNKFQDMNGQRWSDVVKYMLDLDVDQAYAPADQHRQPVSKY